MSVEDLVKSFMECSLGGASKTQLIRTFKNQYELSDKQINKVIQLCSFKEKPKKINYFKFYKNNLVKKCEQIKYPFTQIYKYENFLSDEECDQLIVHIGSNLKASTVADKNDCLFSLIA